MGKSLDDSSDKELGVPPEDWVASKLVGPLTALLLYMDQLHKRRHELSPELRNLIENSFQQANRACSILRERSISPTPSPQIVSAAPKQGVIMFSSTADQKPLTPRERQVLGLILQGFSNKSGARVMNISPRTFESHRAEAFRKVGARNAADLVRKQVRPE